VKVKLIPNVPETLVVGYDDAVKVRGLETVNFTYVFKNYLYGMHVCLPGGFYKQIVEALQIPQLGFIFSPYQP
jgi:hypothetical protein